MASQLLWWAVSISTSCLQYFLLECWFSPLFITMSQSPVFPCLHWFVAQLWEHFPQVRWSCFVTSVNFVFWWFSAYARKGTVREVTLNGPHFAPFVGHVAANLFCAIFCHFRWSRWTEIILQNYLLLPVINSVQPCEDTVCVPSAGCNLIMIIHNKAFIPKI